MKIFKLRPNLKEILLLHWSSWAMYYVGGIQAGWALIPEKQQVYLPLWTEAFVAQSSWAGVILALFLKCIDQAKLPSKTSSTEPKP